MKHIILQTLFRLVNKTDSIMEYNRYLNNTSRNIYYSNYYKCCYRYKNNDKEKKEKWKILKLESM